MNSVLNYIGSKKSLLTFIENVINDINYDKNKNIIFFDGFAGTGIVGKYFNDKYNFAIHSNDLEYYSYIVSYATLKVPYTQKIENKINELNKLKKYKK